MKETTIKKKTKTKRIRERRTKTRKIATMPTATRRSSGTTMRKRRR